jgi:N utilization substance protein A
MQEVPEIYDGVITIRSIACDPGSRAKTLHLVGFVSIDPVLVLVCAAAGQSRRR